MDMKNAKVKRGLRNESQPYIYIQEGQVIIRICLEQQDKFEKWLRIVLQAQKSDDELNIQYKMH